MIEILRLSLPISLWVTGFSAVYALQGLSCSRHWPSDIDAQPILLVAWAVAIAIAIAALVAAVWTMVPVLTASVCL